ncbi:MAG: PASTA domain-containing protein [Acetobacteraceae bacterium]
MPQDQRIDERLARIEQAIGTFEKRIGALERALLGAAERGVAGAEAPIESVLRKRVAELEAERVTLSQRVAALAEGRLQARPEQITEGFRKAIEALQGGLAPRPGDRTAYAVSELQVGLKSLVALDKDGAVSFVLPAPDERFDPAQLTEVKFTLRAASEAARAVPGLIAVPSLLGLPLAAAETALSRAGLKRGETTGQESRYAPGTVIGQSPDPGDEVAPDVPVELVLAVPIRPTVPDLRGLPLEEAAARIEAAGLVSGRVARQESRDVKEGHVIGQDPPPGARVDPGAAVALVVALAPPKTVLVPDVTGQPRAAADLALRSSGLVPGEVSEKRAGRPGLVLAQAPRAGTEVPPGSPVSLVVSAPVEVEVLIERAVKAAAGTRAGISGKLLGERLRALGLKDYAAFEALAARPLEELQKAIGAPTPRGLQDAQAALRKALEPDEG